jgi:uncharacterized protein (TIGR04255 family)
MTTATGDLFPPTPRVLYRNPPLVQVTCQLRFPGILRIEKDAPADFQDRIRHAFPLFERVNPFMQGLPSELLRAIGPAANALTYHFLTEDRKATVELTPQSLGLTVLAYSYWEQFRDQLNIPLAALIEVYQPSFFSRIGLRYQDLIERGKIGLANIPWSRLLRPEILGELADKKFEDHVRGASRTLNVDMPSGAGAVLIRHGFGTAQGRTEVGYVIDLDFSTEQKKEVTDVQFVLARLHEEVGRAFRWCITSELHDALGPTEFDPNELDTLNTS